MSGANASSHLGYYSRRQVIAGSMGLVGSALVGCAGRAVPVAPPAEAKQVYHEPTGVTLPLLEVSGSPFEIGQAIGKRFGDQIRQGFAARRQWFTDLKEFAEAQPANVMDTFVAAARKHPFRAVSIRNEAGTVLEPGPIAIIRDGTFVGEGLIQRIEKGHQSYISYALDTAVNVTYNSRSSSEVAGLVKISPALL